MPHTAAKILFAYRIAANEHVCSSSRFSHSGCDLLVKKKRLTCESAKI